MRVLLVTTDDPGRTGLAQTLKAQGHEVLFATSTGEDLLAAVQNAGRLHAALLHQPTLGLGWPRLLRQLRQRVPSLPAVVLLGSGAEQRWRLAILAGAFDVLPESAPEETVLRAVCRALSYSSGRLLLEPSLPEVSATRGAARSRPTRDRRVPPAPGDLESAA